MAIMKELVKSIFGNSRLWQSLQWLRAEEKRWKMNHVALFKSAGRGAVVWPRSDITYHENIVVGEGVRIGSGALINAYGGLVIMGTTGSGRKS